MKNYTLSNLSVGTKVRLRILDPGEDSVWENYRVFDRNVHDERSGWVGFRRRKETLFVDLSKIKTQPLQRDADRNFIIDLPAEALAPSAPMPRLPEPIEPIFNRVSETIPVPEKLLKKKDIKKLIKLFDQCPGDRKRWMNRVINALQAQ